jgi:hypothetical protein
LPTIALPFGSSVDELALPAVIPLNFESKELVNELEKDLKPKNSQIEGPTNGLKAKTIEDEELVSKR